MVAPGFRSRIATGLLVAAVVMPVPVGAGTATASDRQSAPVDRSPNLIRPSDSPDGDVLDDVEPLGFGLDDFAADDRLSELSPADGPAGAGHAGHPGAPARLRELPDRFDGLPYALGGFPHWPSHRPGHGRWHWHHHHHPFGPGSYGPYRDDFPSAGGRRTGPRDADRAHPRPGRHGPSSKRHAPSASASHAAGPARPSPSHRVSVAERRTERPYEKLPPLPTPSATQKGAPSPGTTDGEAEATPGPYAMEVPQAPVERVLPMGAGLALTGLGLAFLGLRLRRR